MSVNDVYTKLRTAPNYHPASVDLFDDCTLQAGDVVTVRSGNDSYALPIFSQHLVWNGASTTQLESTGNEKRSDLPPLRKKNLNTAYGLGAGGYGTQKSNEEKFKKYETHFEQTDMYFSFLATESEWDELAQEGHVTAYTQILQTARDVSIVAAKTGIEGLEEGETLYSKISQNAGEISTLVSKTGINSLGQDETLYSKVTQTEESITSVVNKTGVNSLGQSETLYSKISQNATDITSKVGKGEISSTINQTAQSVLIQASKIDLDGYVTVSDLEATNASISNLTSGLTTATLIKTVALHVSNGFTFRGSIVDSFPVTVGQKRFTMLSTNEDQPNSIVYSDLPHYHAITASEGTGANAGKIVLTLGAAQAEEGTTNFNIAATQTYINAVAAAKASIGITGSWNDGIYTASTTGQTTAHTVSTELSEITNNGTPTKSGKSLVVPCKVTTTENATVLTDNVTASAAAVYNDGWAAARRKVSLPSAGTETTFSFQGPPETVDGNATTYTYTITKGTPSANGGYAAVSRNNTVVARIDISNWWNDGYTAGAGSVSQRSVSSVAVNSDDSTGITYNSTTGYLSVPIKVTYTDNTTWTGRISVNGSRAYNAGSSAGAASVGLSGGAASTSNIVWNTTDRKIGSVTGTVTVYLSNGNSYSRTVSNITAPSVYDVNVNTLTDKCTVYYRNVSSGNTSSDVFDW